MFAGLLSLAMEVELPIISVAVDAQAITRRNQRNIGRIKEE